MTLAHIGVYSAPNQQLVGLGVRCVISRQTVNYIMSSYSSHILIHSLLQLL